MKEQVDGLLRFLGDKFLVEVDALDDGDTVKVTFFEGRVVDGQEKRVMVRAAEYLLDQYDDLYDRLMGVIGRKGLMEEYQSFLSKRRESVLSSEGYESEGHGESEGGSEQEGSDSEISESEESTSSKKSNESASSKDSSKSESSADSQNISVAMQREGSKTIGTVDADGNVSIADSRPRTEIGPQGEHVTAYVLYEELIYSSLEGKRVAKAKDALLETFKCLPLTDKALGELRAKADAFGKNEELFTREERKELTRTLRGVNYMVESRDILSQTIQKELRVLQKEKTAEINALQNALKGLERLSEADPEKVKDAIRTSNRARLAPEVAQLMDICLQGSNKMEYVSFPSEGNKLQTQAGLERKAINNLRLLNDFLLEIKEISELEDDANQQKRIVEYLEENEKELEKKWPDLKGEVGNLLAGRKLINDDEFEGLITQVSQHVTDLFWYPRIDDNKLLDPDSEVWNKIKKAKYNSAAMPRDNDVDKLYQVGARHLVVVFNCFKGLGEFEVDSQEAITNGFLKNVVERQGWGGDDDVGEFIDEIKNKAVLQYDSKRFYTQGSEKQREAGKASQPSTSLGY